MTQSLHFAHGNGFPSLCYKELFTYLDPTFSCYFIDRVGHSESYPVTDNWDYLVDEVILSIESQIEEPCVAVGHSLGGILSLLAAIKKPTLFKCLILLDSPVLGTLKSHFIRMVKRLGLIDQLFPAAKYAKLRRIHWKTKQEVLNYLKTKPLFNHFSHECLNDYIEYGMQKDDNGYVLRFDRLIEADIYRTIPHSLYQYKQRLMVPTALIYGHNSDVIDSLDRRGMKKHYNIVSIKTKGTHMFPMEYPRETAALIIKTVDELIK